jgi:hypothetical protein
MKYIIKTIADEGTAYEKVRETEFTSAIEAVTYYNNIMDYGFAAYNYTVIFIEPDGAMYHKSYPSHASGKPVKFEERTIRYQVVS